MRSHRNEVEIMGICSSDMENTRARALGVQSKAWGTSAEKLDTMGFWFPPDGVGSYEDTKNRCSKAVTKTRSKSIFLSRREDLCVLKGSCLEQDKWKEILTVHLLTTFLNFKIKVTTKSWQNVDRRKHQKSAPRGSLKRKCCLAGQRFSVSDGGTAAKALREK